MHQGFIQLGEFFLKIVGFFN